jgi:4-aminobutyrate aminotransferase-like enzyme
LVLHDQFSSISEIRGRGLMLGIEFKNSPKNLVLILSKRLLQKGFIVLPCGLDGDTLSLTPPLTIQKEHIDLFIHTLKTLLSV